MLPLWHFAHLLDVERNTALERGLPASLAGCRRVLEIGTGVGLVAMLAARSCEAEIVTCESDPEIYKLALETFERNGLSERIRLLNTSSRDLSSPNLFDAIIIDNFSDDVVGYGGLADIWDARNRLLAVGGRIIPNSIHLSACLVSGGDHCSVLEQVKGGFVFSHLERFMPTNFRIIDNMPGYAFNSEPSSIISISFNKDFSDVRSGRAPMRVSQSGVISGVLIWSTIEWLPGMTVCYGPHGKVMRIRNPILMLQRKPLKVTKDQVVMLEYEIRDQQVELELTDAKEQTNRPQPRGTNDERQKEGKWVPPPQPMSPFVRLPAINKHLK